MPDTMPMVAMTLPTRLARNANFARPRRPRLATSRSSSLVRSRAIAAHMADAWMSTKLGQGISTVPLSLT